MKPLTLKRTNSLTIQNKSRMSQSDHKQQSIKSNQAQSKKVPIYLTRTLQANSKKAQQQIGVKDILRSALRMFVCKLCYNNVQFKDTNCIGECGHVFCVNCLTQYSIYKININQDVLCPAQSCSTVLVENSLFYQTLPEEIKKKFKDHQVWKQTLDNPNVKLCPSQNCHGGLIDLLKHPPECEKCHTQFCKQCMMKAHQGPCDENFQIQFKQWKRCPKCKIFIQKTQGCNHMVCRCKHQFCFVCLADWEQSHYQCVQGLQNRLFFSQAEQMPKGTSFLALLGLTMLFPFLIVGLIIMLVVGMAFTCVMGIIVSPCVLAKQVSGCSCFGLCCLIGLPFAMAIGAIAAPIFFIISVFKPFAHRVTRQYCNSMTFLKEQIAGPRPRRR